MNPAVLLQQIDFAYGRAMVLQDLSFGIESGEVLIGIGPNGSGKTTLMKVMAGILRPQKGSRTLLGRPFSKYRRRELARNIAYVPQMIGGNPPFTVREMVLMGRSPYLGMLGVEGPTDQALADQAMTFTGVDHLQDRHLDQLSGGERQRVHIARAICQEPRVILLDEPTAALDLAHQIRIMDLMARLAREKGVAVFMVLHDINLAAMYAGRVLLLDKGRIMSLGAPDQVLTGDSLERVYGCNLLIDRSPVGEFPRITLVPGNRL